MEPFEIMARLKTFAVIRQTARYNDGNYKIYSRMTDLRGNHSYSDTLAFELDNFNPVWDFTQ